MHDSSEFDGDDDNDERAGSRSTFDPNVCTVGSNRNDDVERVPTEVFNSFITLRNDVKEHVNYVRMQKIVKTT